MKYNYGKNRLSGKILGFTHHILGKNIDSP